MECPARLDLAGGWSDTPPISYEKGGSVVNISILVDGKVSTNHCGSKSLSINSSIIINPNSNESNLWVKR